MGDSLRPGGEVPDDDSTNVRYIVSEQGESEECQGDVGVELCDSDDSLV